MLRTLISLLCVSLFACTQNPTETVGVPTETIESDSRAADRQAPLPDVVGLWKPEPLQGVETRLLPADYFLDPMRIDSVQAIPGLTSELAADRSELIVRIIGDIGRHVNLRFFVGEQTYDLLLVAPVKRPVTLRLRDDGYQKVAVKGEMNAWNPQLGKMELRNGIWEADFQLRPGDYQYMFMVDGKEMIDPKNPRKVPNGQGGTNSLLSLKQPDPNRLPSLVPVAAEPGQVFLQVDNPGSFHAYWQNHRVSVGKSNGQYRITIPREALDLDRSFIRVYSANESGTGNDLLIPLSGRQVVTDASELSRHDAETQIMYFVLVDRFVNGDPTNDEPVDDPRVLPPANYQGGDLQGIIEKLDDGYFESLHVNSIWLSPITQNPENAWQEYPEPNRWYTGYHGYWPVRSAKVDHRFGDAATMTSLSETAHTSGVNLLLDYVANHVHENHPIYQNNPDWATKKKLEDGTMNIRIWEEQRLTTWFDSFLPTLDLSREEVIQTQVDSIMFWMNEYQLDGFRHDATKHIPTDFWRALSRRIKTEVMGAEGRSVYQIGETYGSRELIASYINSGQLDAQFDFALYFPAREVFARPETSFDILESNLRETFNYFGYHSTMGNMSGNHDQARFISLAGGDLAFDENPVEAGFTREIGVGDPVGYRRLAMLHAFNFAIPGVPVIFYGDEIGLPGAGDPDNRRMMRFSDLSENEQWLLERVRKLTELRRNSMALLYGETETEVIDPAATYRITRTWMDEQVHIVFNKSDQEQVVEITLPERMAAGTFQTAFGGRLEQRGNRLRVTLAPHSFDYIRN